MKNARGFALGSVLLIIVFALIVGAVGFYIGTKNPGVITGLTSGTSGATSTSTGYYQDVSAWQTYRSDRGGFSIAYPIDFSADQPITPASTTDWRVSGNGTPGFVFFTLTVPKAFEPQTNFSDAKLTVSESSDASAVTACLTPDQSGAPSTASSTVTLGGTPFTKFVSSGAGAGNLYETTSYRAVKGNTCYAIEYTIHSTQIANYPAEYGLTPFDKSKLTDLLDRISSTFRFL